MALWSYNAFTGRTWGLMRRMIPRLYKQVIIPKITYPTIEWWDRMNTASARSEQECLQTVTCIMITVTRRTTPITKPEMFLDLLPLEMVVETTALMAEYRPQRLNSKDLEIRHSQFWVKADKVD